MEQCKGKNTHASKKHKNNSHDDLVFNECDIYTESIDGEKAKRKNYVVKRMKLEKVGTLFCYFVNRTI